MDFKKQVFNLVQELSGTENHITVNKFYLKYTGDLQAGAFLSQLIYWADKSSRKDGFFYKTYEEWQNELFMSEYSIRKTTKELKKLGFLETKLIKANGAPTLHYKIDKLKFLEEIMRFLAEEKEAAAKEKPLQDGTETDKKTGETVENSGICENEEWNLRIQRMESANSKNGICENEETLTSVTTSDTTSDTNNIKNNSAFSSSSKKESKKKSLLTTEEFEICKQVIDYLNEKASKRFRTTTAETQRLIKKRLEEEYTIADFKRVVDVKTSEWMNTEWERYLQPSTLFSDKNFEKYLNQPLKKSTKRVNDPNDYGAEYFDNLEKQKQQSQSDAEAEFLGW